MLNGFAHSGGFVPFSTSSTGPKKSRILVVYSGTTGNITTQWSKNLLFTYASISGWKQAE